MNTKNNEPKKQLEEIFEHDYYEEKQKLIECQNEKGIFELSIEKEIFKAIENRYHEMPHIIDCEKKQFYENCLKIMDTIAMRYGGKIKGVISYKVYDAYIELTLPFFEFYGSEDIRRLQYIINNARMISFTHTENSKIQLKIYIDYFQEIGDFNKIVEEELQKHPEIIDLLKREQNNEIQSILIDPELSAIITSAAKDVGVTPEEYLERFDQVLNENPEALLDILDQEMERKHGTTDF